MAVTGYGLALGLLALAACCSAGAASCLSASSCPHADSRCQLSWDGASELDMCRPLSFCCANYLRCLDLGLEKHVDCMRWDGGLIECAKAVQAGAHAELPSVVEACPLKVDLFTPGLTVQVPHRGPFVEINEFVGAAAKGGPTEAPAVQVEVMQFNQSVTRECPLVNNSTNCSSDLQLPASSPEVVSSRQ